MVCTSSRRGNRRPKSAARRRHDRLARECEKLLLQLQYCEGRKWLIDAGLLCSANPSKESAYLAEIIDSLDRQTDELHRVLCGGLN